ncbi:MAG: MATE family efflux transporter [Planctomycetota bacterium]
MKTESLTSGSIPLHIRRIALPSSIGLFFQTMYNVVDSFYAGQISTIALAAMAISFPVFLLIIATSGGLSRGASALIANAIGAGDETKQRRFITQTLSLGFFASIGMTVVGLLASDPLFRSLGAEGEYLELAHAYMTPVFIGSIVFVLSSLSNAILIASGDSRTYSKVLITGFFLNLILDPWFLYGGFGLPAMGISGIAWATVVIQTCGCIYMVNTIVTRGFLDLKCRRHLLPDIRIWLEILQQGIPASFNIMSVAFGFFAVTYFLKPYGESTVAAFGVTTRIEQIALLPTFGLYAAIMALVGQNNGAGDFDRVRETMRVTNRVGLVLIVVSSVLMFALAVPLMRIFTSDQEVIRIGKRYIQIMACIQWSYVMTSTHLAFLQAIKRPFYGFFESPLRKVLLPLPFLFMLVPEHSVDVVWYTIAGTNVFMTVITVIYGQVMLRRLN